MLRRCPTPSTMLVAALVSSLGLQPSFTRAAASSSTLPSSTYSFTTSTAIPALGPGQPTETDVQNASTLGIGFQIQPDTALDPNSYPLAGPISVTPATGSSNQAQVSIATGQTNGQPYEVLGLFFSQGLQAGSVIQFPLYYSSSTPPQLIPETPGVTAYTPPSSESSNSSTGSQTTSGGVTSDVQTPEPLSLLIWVGLAGVALARARFLRQSRRTALGG